MKDLGDYKNALPDEVEDRRNSETPHELHTQADDEAPLSRLEAEVAGLLPGEEVYGESDNHETSDDRRDIEHADPGEHL